MAIKILSKEKNRSFEDALRLHREIDILKQVKHPNLIECYDVIETPDHWYLVMEYASGGDLFDYVVAKG